MADTLLLKRAVANADIFALLSAAFSFPTEETARGISSGNLKKDFLACLQELEISKDQIEEFEEAFSKLETSGEDLSFKSMNKEHSYLYLVLGGNTRIFPFEAAFLHVAEGRGGVPALFIAARTLDARHWMKRCGVLPENANIEPVDSIYGELDFMRLLYTSLANALQIEDDSAASAWTNEIDGFRKAHIDTWVPAFMERTIAESRTPVYRELAKIALLSLTTIPSAEKDCSI
jgi:TorA maturation chaperone TorD